jgi:hypothetical protein
MTDKPTNHINTSKRLLTTNCKKNKQTTDKMREVGGSLAKAAFDLLMSSQPSTLHNMIFIKQTYIRNHTKQLLVTTAIPFIPFGLLAPKDFLMTNYLAFQYYD